MTQQLLHQTYISPIVQKMGGIGVPQYMRGKWFLPPESSSIHSKHTTNGAHRQLFSFVRAEQFRAGKPLPLQLQLVCHQHLATLGEKDISLFVSFPYYTNPPLFPLNVLLLDREQFADAATGIVEQRKHHHIAG